MLGEDVSDVHRIWAKKTEPARRLAQ
jgi:hypothetical protein